VLSDEIATTLQRIEMQRTMADLKLKNERNRIMRLELMVSICGLATGITAAIAGLFGMNLLSGLEESTHAFPAVVAASGAGSALLVGFLVRGIGRFNASQLQHLARSGNLERALHGLEHAYFALRAHSALAEQSEGESSLLGDGGKPPSMAELRDSLQGSLDAEESATLFRILDTNDDGILQPDELLATPQGVTDRLHGRSGRRPLRSPV